MTEARTHVSPSPCSCVYRSSLLAIFASVSDLDFINHDGYTIISMVFAEWLLTGLSAVRWFKYFGYILSYFAPLLHYFRNNLDAWSIISCYISFIDGLHTFTFVKVNAYDPLCIWTVEDTLWTLLSPVPLIGFWVKFKCTRFMQKAPLFIRYFSSLYILFNFSH